MIKDKKERIKKLYLLERIVYENKDQEGIERLRTELKCNNFEVIKGKPKGSKHFDINRYIEAKEEYPKLTDNEIAALLDVSPQTLATAKRRNGLCKRQNTSAPWPQRSAGRWTRRRKKRRRHGQWRRSPQRGRNLP